MARSSSRDRNEVDKAVQSELDFTLVPISPTCHAVEACKPAVVGDETISVAAWYSMETTHPSQTLPDRLRYR